MLDDGGMPRYRTVHSHRAVYVLERGSDTRRFCPEHAPYALAQVTRGGPAWIARLPEGSTLECSYSLKPLLEVDGGRVVSRETGQQHG